MPGPHFQNKRDAIIASGPGSARRGGPTPPAQGQTAAAYAGLRHFEEYPVPTLAYDISSKNIIFWNAALSRLTGYSAREFPLVTGFVDT